MNPPPSLRFGSPLGTASDEHLHVVVRDGWVDLRVTHALMRTLTASSAVTPAVAPGAAIQQGDVVAVFRSDLDDYVVRSPLTGVAGITCGGTAAEWELVIVPSRWEHEASCLGWGDAGLGLYAAVLRDARRHGSPFSELRMEWLRSHSARGCATSALAALAALRDRPRFSDGDAAARAIGGALTAAVDAPGAAPLTRLDLVVGFRMHDPALDLVLRARSPVPQVVLGAPPPDADLVVLGSSITVDDWLAGRLDLPAALRRGEIQSSAPSQVLRLASVLSSLHADYAQQRLRRC